MEVSALSSSPTSVVQTIHQDPIFVEALGKLGRILDSGEEPTISPETRASLRSCLEQVRSDPTNAKAWTALGDIASECAPAPLPEDLRDCKRQCYVEALKYDPKFSTAWKQLGKTLRVGDEVTVEAAKHSSTLRTTLSAGDRVTVNGEKYGETQCYLEALLHDPNCAEVWYNLGFSLKETELVAFRGVKYTQEQCYIEALRHNPTLSRAWCAMSPTLKARREVLINGQTYTRKECLVEALTHDPKNMLAWYRLGNALGSAESATVRHATYTKRQCYIESLTNNPTHAFSWANLGAILTQDVKVIVNGRSYTRQECCIEALRMDSTHARIWANLGGSMGEAEVAVISGSRYTKRECLLEAIRLDPTFECGWDYLANSLTSTELVLVCGSIYTAADCRSTYYECRRGRLRKEQPMTQTIQQPLSQPETAALAASFAHWKLVSWVPGRLRRLRREAESRVQRVVLHRWFDWFYRIPSTNRTPILKCNHLRAINSSTGIDGPILTVRPRFVTPSWRASCRDRLINSRVTATLVHGRSAEDNIQLVEAEHRSRVQCVGAKAIPTAEFLGSYCSICSIEGIPGGSPSTAATSDYFLHGGAGFPFPPLPVHRPSGQLMSPALLSAIQTGGLNGRVGHRGSVPDSAEEALHRPPSPAVEIDKNGGQEVQLYVVQRPPQRQ